MRDIGSLAAALIAVMSASTLAAQDSAQHAREHQPSEFEKRSSLTVAFAQTRPTGDLSRNIGFGYGATGTYHFRLDGRGIWSLRTDVGFSEYGDDVQRVPLNEISGRIQLKVQTTNNIVPFSIGPELMWPAGSIRPYVNAGVGGQWFYTESHLEGDDGDGSVGQTTNQHDFAPAWTAGGGIAIPVVPGRTNVSVDLGAQYVSGGQARYLNKQSIVDLPDGSVQISPLQTMTHLLIVRAGVRISL